MRFFFQLLLLGIRVTTLLKTEKKFEIQTELLQSGRLSMQTQEIHSDSESGLLIQSNIASYHSIKTKVLTQQQQQ